MVRVVSVALLLASTSALAGFATSSHKQQANRGVNWGAASAVDGKADTCWMIDAEQSNKGQWIHLDVPSATVDSIAVVVGWDKSENDFFDYARMKKIKIEVFDMGGDAPALKHEQTADLEDKRGWQVVDLTDTKVGGEILGGRVRVTVLEVYDGKDYPNLAVSDVQVRLKEFSADSLTLSNPPMDVAAGDPFDMVDGNARTFWAPGAAVEKPGFGVSAPGYGLSSLGLQAGPAGYDRAKTVQLVVNELESVHTLEDSANLQWIQLPALVGYTGSAWGEIKVNVMETYTTGGKGVAFSEAKLRAATIEDF